MLRKVALFRQVPLRVSVKFPLSAGLALIALKASILASMRFRVERAVILRPLMTGRRSCANPVNTDSQNMEAKA